MGINVYMGTNQEDYDEECAALAWALEEASSRNTIPERVTIFTDAQAAIRRMASDQLGSGQQYALQVRKHIATLRRARPGIVIEIRWCPAHKGVVGNEKADEWAKAAAEQAGGHRPIPRSLANLKRDISEKKWAEARQWAGGRTSKKKYHMPKSQRPDGAVAGSTKRLDSRFYQLKTGHCLTGQYLNWTTSQPTPQCWWCQFWTQTRDHLFKKVPQVEAAAEDPVGGGKRGNREGQGQVEGPEPPGGWEVRAGGAGLPLHHRRREAVASGGRGRRQRGVRAGDAGVVGGAGGGGRGSGRRGDTTVPTHA